MRLKITMQPVRPDSAIPINYQYPLSSAIYRILSQAEPAYASFLHDEGYPASNNRRMKLFAFSRIFSVRPAKVDHRTLRWYGKAPLWLYVSSPMEETFIHAFVIGLLKRNSITIARNGIETRFGILAVEPIPPPVWETRLSCRCLSPMVVSVQDDSHRHAQYLPPNDPRFIDGIRMNLLRKHELLHGPFTEPMDCLLAPDAEYIIRKGGVDHLTKLITIKEGEPEESRIRGYVFPFALEMSQPMLATAWDCGLGEKNSSGFGMWEIFSPHNTSEEAE